MEATITNKHGKKKIHPLSSLNIGGEGGIAGLLVFGGALAIAGFMAVTSFASNKNKAKATPPKPQQQLLLDDDGCDKSEDNHDTSQSLTSVLQHSTTQVGDVKCCWTSNMSINQVNSNQLLSAQSSVVEEKIVLKPNSVEDSPTCYHQEIVFSDHSHPESATSSNENGVAEECLASLFNSSCGQAQEVEEDGFQDDLTSTETETETETEDETDDNDDVTEISEEDSSKATGTTSLDHSEVPVWPAELIQEREEQFRRNYCDSHVCSDSDADGSDYAGNYKAMRLANEATLNKTAKSSMGPNDQSSVLTTWVIPMLLLTLMLIIVLLTHQESFFVLDDGNSVIVP